MANSGIYYALLARERVVLCDGGREGFEKSSQAVLENIKPEVNMISYESNNHIFHVMLSGELRYICVTDRVFDRQVAFAFLKELESQLISTGLQERAGYVGPYALRQEFGSVMNTQLRKYSSSDQLNHLQDRVNEVTGVMTDNIEKIMRRGEALEDLTDRSTLLAHSCTGHGFRQSSYKPREKLFWKSTKMWVILIIVLVIILVVILAAILTGLAATGHFNKKS